MYNSKKKDQCTIKNVTKRFYITKDKQGNYQLLNELAYEKKLVYG